MLLFSVQPSFSDYASDEVIAAGPVSFSLLQAETDEPPPWPLVIVLPLITGLSMSLWVGIGKLLGMLITG